jgi:hypothetical protein
VWVVLLTQADDEGRLVCDAAQVRVWGFAYHTVTDGDVEAGLQEVAQLGLIRLYQVNGTRYAVFPSWRDHQRINRPAPSKLPEPPPFSECSLNTHGGHTEHSMSTHAGSDQGSDQDQGSDGEGKGGEWGTIGEPNKPALKWKNQNGKTELPPTNGEGTIDKAKIENMKRRMFSTVGKG